MSNGELITVSPSMGLVATPENLRAQQALQTGVIPKEMLRTHPGRSGKVFTYLSHTYATDLLLHSGLLFSHDVTSFQIFDDGTAVATVRLTIHSPLWNPDGTLGRVLDQTITEVGAYAGAIEDKAYCVAAAASRGLVKCLMRRFGTGIELYKMDDTMTPVQAWDALWSYMARGVKGAGEQEKAAAREELIARLKAAGISAKTNLVDRFEEAYEIAYNLLLERAGRKTESPPTEDEPAQAPRSPLSDALAAPVHRDSKIGLRKGDPLSLLIEKDHAGNTSYRAVEYLSTDNSAPEALRTAAAFLLEHWAEVQERYPTPEPQASEAKDKAGTAKPKMPF